MIPVIRRVFSTNKCLSARRTGAGVRVRRACTSADADSITRVVENIHRDDWRIRSAPGLLAELAGRPGRSVVTWLAFVEEAPVGLAAVVSAGDGPSPRHSIAWLLVARQARRRGVGSALVAAIVGDARDRGIAEIWVETHADWSAAVAFWQAVGFRRVP